MTAILVTALAQFGCNADTPSDTSPVAPRLADRVWFEPEAQSAEPVVRDFVNTAMIACVAGDYPSVRGVWSAADIPIEQHQFERRWQPIDRIVIHRLEKVRREDEAGEADHYYLAARFHLGADAPEPERDLILLVVRENEAWHLARPPKGFAERIRKRTNLFGET